MFRPPRLHRLHRFDGHGFGDRSRASGGWGWGSPRAPWPQPGEWTHAGPWRRHRRRRGPSLALILLAGLAAFALVKLLSAAERGRRSTLEKLVLGGLLVAAAAVVYRMRQSGRRYYG